MHPESKMAQHWLLERDSDMLRTAHAYVFGDMERMGAGRGTERGGKQGKHGDIQVVGKECGVRRSSL